MVMMASELSVLFFITLEFEVLSSFQMHKYELSIASGHDINTCANPKLLIGLPPMEIMVMWSCRVYCLILSKNTLKRVGKRSQPCLTPAVVLKDPSTS